jgi:hypothetical protein
MSVGLTDLDELVLDCRTPEAKRYIEEAVKCYAVGAFRPAIVATWIAVAYDFVDKLRELELAGDKNAKKKMEEFERIRSKNDLKGALEFERTLLDVAKDEFELLSNLEHSDLKRLFEDRNRCAHPSMISSDEIYQPSGEVARYHIRNAVVHFLKHPPLQGPAALERLLKQIDSQYFPTSPEEAKEHLAEGPLRKPREALVRNLVVVLIKQILEGIPTSARRNVAALKAVWSLHQLVTEQTIKAKISDLISSIGDKRLIRVIGLLVSLPVCWDSLGNAGQIRVRKYITDMPQDEIPTALPFAFTSDRLRPYAEDCLARLLKEYAKAKNWNDANARAETLKRLVPQFDLKKIVTVVSAGADNPEVKTSFGFSDLTATIRASGKIEPGKLDELLELNGLKASAR